VIIVTQSTLAHPKVVSRDEWLVARKELLAKEKELTRHRDAVNAERRGLPMVEIDEEYVFEGPAGAAGLLDLFDGRCQLVIYHFMFHRDQGEGCPGCSHLVDNIGHLAHLHARDTSFALVSRAPLAEIEPFKVRMGWALPWYSSFGSDFNYDFHVTLDEAKGSVEWNYQSAAALQQAGKIPSTKGELPGLSVFLREGDRIFHAYSTYARGLDALFGTYNLLDLTPFGRGEGWDGMPDLDGMGLNWLRHHDKYDERQRSSHA
jgi:predicted dithiol-disulfide oxidoreductase (DUF899 family)